ncbi:CAP domain-containing protein [Yoonia sp. 2307UL14-13]|uniref:CAP domain-containing protein n=1 Tax=Yoonia sp. 2307UL14-13 TaxID=3126506 RepID=UPI0030A3A8C8
MRFIIAVLLVFGMSACVVPVPVTSAAPAGNQPVGRPDSSEFTTRLNALRAERSLRPLVRNARLDRAAKAHANDMAQRGYFSHRGADGSSAGDRIGRAGYQACGWAENIADGYRGPSAAFAGWEGSAGHRRNMLGRNYTEYGLANTGGKWVMVLARRC